MAMTKLRNIFPVFLTVSAAVVLSSCEKETATLPSANPSRAVGFSVYTAGMPTKGTELAREEIYGTLSPSVEGSGIGVFAFVQPNSGGYPVDFNTHKFSGPDFMCNQKVTTATPGNPSSWVYNPIKYWPTEPNDQVSFFAYAPFDDTRKWEDLNIATNKVGTVITTSVPIYDIKSEMKDVLWADPILNRKGVPAPSAVQFKFRHLLSKVSIRIGINDGFGAPCAWTDANTTMTIDKIKFSSLANSYDFTCPLPMPEDASDKWLAGSSTQDITLFRLADAVHQSDLDADSTLINTTNYNTAAYHTILKEEDGKPGFLFLAPQTFTEGVQTVTITYTVVTTDALNPSNSSTKTNTLIKNLSSILPSGLESGRAYVIRFLLNPESVSINGNVSAW